MISQPSVSILRWLLVPVAAFSGIVVALLPFALVNRIVHDILWSHGQAMPGKVFLGHYSLPIGGAFAAFFFVLLGAWMAPEHRSRVAVALLLIGGLLAWFAVGNFYSPEFQWGRPPLRVWEPIVATCCGGLAGCAVVCFRSFLRWGRPQRGAEHAENELGSRVV